MSWETVNTGLRAATTINTEKRKQRLEELQQHIKGFELDKASNKYVENERGAMAMDLQAKKLEQSLMYVNAQNNMMSSVLNAQSMTDATSALLMGDHATAAHAITTNPILKENLKNKFGVVSVAPVDWENDKHLFAQHGINISDEALKNPKIRQAFNSAFSKIIKTDGTTDILGTEVLAKETGYLNYLPPKEKGLAIKRFNMLKQIISGHITTPEEEAVKAAKLSAEAAKAEAIASQAKFTEHLTNIKKHDLDKFFAEHPNATLADYMAANTPVDPVKQQINKEKQTQEALKTQQQKLKINAQENNLELQKIKLKEEQLKLDKIDKEAKNVVKQLTPAEKAVKAKSILKVDNPDPVTIEAARDYEADSIKHKLIDAKKLQDIRTQADFVNDFKALEKTASHIDTDAIESIKTDIRKVLGVSGSKEEVAQKLSKLKLDTQIGLTLRRFLKFMSGAAVSNEEFEGYVQLFKGGNWSDDTALRETIRTFRETLEQSTLRSTKSISSDAPYTAYRVKRILGSIDSNSVAPTNQTPTNQTPTSKMPNNQAPADKKSSRPKLEDFEV